MRKCNHSEMRFWFSGRWKSGLKNRFNFYSRIQEALLECVNSISGENPQALEAKEEIKKINANPSLEVEQGTIIFWVLSRKSHQSNQNQKCWKREGKHLNIVKILSTLWYGSTALLSFPSNPLVPLLKVAQISLIPPFRSFDHNFTIFIEDWSEHIRLTKINL